MTIHLDFETYSEVDIKSVGAWAYAAHPSTEVLLVGYAQGGGRPKVWDVASGDPAPDALQALVDSGAPFHAFNAQFERAVWHYHMAFLFGEVAPSRWRCTMAQAHVMGFAGSLGDITAAIGLETKQADGKHLVLKFCKPQPSNRKVRRWGPHSAPEEWALFKSYCAQDIVAERALSDWCLPLSDEEQRLYELDQEINARGLPVDGALVQQALQLEAAERERLMRELVDLTGLPNPNSSTQMKAWLQENGYAVPDTTKGTLAALRKALPGGSQVARALDLCAQLNLTSVTKWHALERATVYGRLRGAFQFRGASHTGRWAGRLFQPQNLPRPAIPDPDASADALAAGDAAAACGGTPAMEVLSSLLRSAIKAPAGKTLVAADLGSIESRLLGWVCDCPAINRVFDSGRDLYKDFGAALYGTQYDAVTKEQRQMAKPPTLGCGYRLGAAGLVKYAAAMGVEMLPAFAEAAVKKYRERHPEVVRAWYALEDAVKSVTEHAVEFEGYRVRIYRDAAFLHVQLPSGRRLHYYQPAVMDMPMPWGDTKAVFTYMGQNSMTKKWERLAAHGGLLVENVIQAVACDILTEGLLRCADAGLPVVGHVHDEIIAEVSDGRGAAAAAFLVQAMAETPQWAPGLRLTASAEGYPSKRYRK